MPAEKLVVALFDYVSEAEETMSMEEGETFVVIEEDSNGWTVVRKKNGTAEGYVPTTYLENVS